MLVEQGRLLRKDSPWFSRTRGGTQEGEVLGRTVHSLVELGRLLRKDTLC